MEEFFRNILTALSISIITSIITVKLSIRQFYSQKWWEKKAEAYSNIIEHLSYLQCYFGEWFDHGIGLKELSENKKKKLLNDYIIAKENLMKASAIGAFAISNDAANIITNLLRDLEIEDSQGDWVGDLNRYYGLVKDTIACIREHAKKDLLVK